jgi:hypothetical protein
MLRLLKMEDDLEALTAAWAEKAETAEFFAILAAE